MSVVARAMQSCFLAGKQLPPMLKRPKLIGVWLLTAYFSHFTLIVAVLFSIFVAPILSAHIADALYPPEKEGFRKRLVRVFKPQLKEMQNPLRDIRYEQYFLAISVGAFVPSIIFLFFHVPRAVQRGRERAKQKLVQAVRESASGESHVQALTQEARQLVLDEQELVHLTSSLEAYSDDDDFAGQSGSDSTFVGTDVTQERELMSANKAFEGQKHERYRLEKNLASGGAGVVFAAYDEVLGRRVAIKQLLDHLSEDEESNQRFIQEAKALAGLNHPNIVPIYDLFKTDGKIWMVMELLQGNSLREKIRQSPLSTTEALLVARHVALGLAYAHQKGIIHRDIKPDNILFDETGLAKIVDFGIARPQESAVKTQVGYVLGSAAYMSPEQAVGRTVDVGSDIYSLGVTLYEMLAGQTPFNGAPTEVMRQQVCQSPPRLAEYSEDLPRAVELVVLKMMQKQPENRFKSCAQVAMYLQKVIEKIE